MRVRVHVCVSCVRRACVSSGDGTEASELSSVVSRCGAPRVHSLAYAYVVLMRVGVFFVAFEKNQGTL